MKQLFTKKTRLWIALALVGILAPALAAIAAGLADQITVTVGSAKQTGKWVPAFFDYQNSYSETIYPASELVALDTEKPIKSLSFHGICSSELKDVEFTVYLKNETGSTTIAASKSDLSGFTKFYEGKMNIYPSADQANSQIVMTIPAQADFTYAGDNLRVVVKMHSETTGTVNWSYQPSAKASFICYNQDGAEERAPYITNYLPVMTVGYEKPAPKPEDFGEPKVVLTTSLQPGEDILIGVGTYKGGIAVDFGDGKIKEYPYPGNLTLSNTIMGKTIKVYTIDNADLIIFHCNQSGITDVQVKDDEMIELYLNNNNLKSIDLIGVPKLETLWLVGNEFDVFECYNDHIKDLNLSKNKLQQLVLTDMKSLESLDVSVNLLRTPIWLFWPEAPGLKNLNVSFNAIPSLDVSKYPNLETLICNNNNFDMIGLKDNTALTTLNASLTGVQALDFTETPNLKNLDLSATKVGNVALNKLPKLERLKLQLNTMTELDLEENTALKYLDVSRNSLTNLDLTSNADLEHLDYADNGIKTLPEGQYGKLRYLNCKSNGVSTLALDGMNSLDSLYCQVNSLSEIDLSKASVLRVLDCSSNSFKNLNLKKSQMLQVLNCADNMLTSLDVTANTELISLDLHTNQLNAAALDKLFMDLPDINGLTITPSQESWKAVLNFKNNPGALEVSTEIPETKGWICNVAGADILGDASGVFTLPTSLVNTRMGFELASPEPTVYIDWGDGVKTAYSHEEGSTSDYLNISGVVAGTEVRIYAPKATSIGIANNQVQSIYLGGMPELNFISCGGNNISELDFTKNAKLQTVAVRKNPLTSLTFAPSTPLRKLDCSNTLIRSLYLQQFDQLEELVVTSNRLETLDLKNCDKLRSLKAEDNNISQIDLSECPNLVELYLSKNQLTEIDLSENLELQYLCLPSNKLKKLDVSMCNYIVNLDVAKNELTSLKFDSDYMKTLLAGTNNLSEIDLSKCAALTTLSLENNKFETVSLAPLKLLEGVWLGNNRLTHIDLGTGLPRLNVFNAMNNKLTNDLDPKLISPITEFVIQNNNFSGTLDMTANTNLRLLYVAHNDIDAIKYPSTNSLISLSAGYNNLKTINVPSTNLSVLDAPRNQIAAVNLANHDNLILLNLDYNNLSSVNLSKNPALEGVSLRANNLSVNALNSIYEQLPDINGLEPAAGHEYWMCLLNVSGNPGAEDSDFGIAAAKGWRVNFNEVLPEVRELTVVVKDQDGNVVENAFVTLIVDTTPVSLKPVFQDGVYAFHELEVFLNHVYYIRVSKLGYDTVTVEVDGFEDGDVTLDVVLNSNGQGVEVNSAEDYTVKGGRGEIVVEAYPGFRVAAFDLTGRVVANEMMTAETYRIENLSAGIYIVNGKKIAVR